jgi:hypothetical protein
MSITNKKLDAIRRLVLGPLYDECKNNPMGVKRADLEAQFEELKGEGCIGGDCGFDELIKLCQLKNHYPSCLSNDRGCIENIGERQTGIKKFYFDQYKRAKQIEDDESSSDEEDEIECPICTMNEDADGIRLVETVTNPQEEQGALSCRHLVHKSCLIREAITRMMDRAVCPLCNKVFDLSEVSVPSRSIMTKDRDELRRNVFNGTQMSKTFEEIADSLLTTVEGLLESLEMTPEEASEYFSIPLEDIKRHISSVNRRLDFGDENILRSDSDDEEDSYSQENMQVSRLIIESDYNTANNYISRYNYEFGPGSWVRKPVLESLFSSFRSTTDRHNLDRLLDLSSSLIDIYNEFMYDDELTETIKDMFNGNRAQKQTAKMLITSLSSHSGSRVEGILKNSILKNYNNIIKFIFEHYERKESDYTVDPYTMNFSPSPKVLLKEIIDRLFEEQDFSRISIETRDLIREWYTDNLYENISI